MLSFINLFNIAVNNTFKADTITKLTEKFIKSGANQEQSAAKDWSARNQQVNNPRLVFFEQRLTALAGGVAALSVKSVRSARFRLIDRLLSPGDEVVNYNSYGLFRDEALYKRRGINIKFTNSENLTVLKSLVTARTKLIYLETISKELGIVPDFQKIIAFAKTHNIPVVVDNSAAPGSTIFKPIANGANVVIEALDWFPYADKHFGAVIIDGGNYAWQNSKLAKLDAKHTSYFTFVEDNLQHTVEGAALTLINLLKRKGNIDYSPYPIPTDPLRLVSALEKLPVQLKTQSENALKLAHWLKDQHFVETINYIGLPTNPTYFNALKFFRYGFGRELAFGIKNSVEMAKYYVDVLKNHTALLAPHVQWDENQKLIRISVPEGHIETLKAELNFAFYQYPAYQYQVSLNDFWADNFVKPF